MYGGTRSYSNEVWKTTSKNILPIPFEIQADWLQICLIAFVPFCLRYVRIHFVCMRVSALEVVVSHSCACHDQITLLFLQIELIVVVMEIIIIIKSAPVRQLKCNRLKCISINIRHHSKSLTIQYTAHSHSRSFIRSLELAEASHWKLLNNGRFTAQFYFCFVPWSLVWVYARSRYFISYPLLCGMLFYVRAESKLQSINFAVIWL